MGIKKQALFLVLIVWNTGIIDTTNAQPTYDLFSALEAKDSLGIVQAIAEGAQVNFQDSYSGETPLHFASYSQSLFAVSLLLTKGAKVNVLDKTGLTPLIIACGNNSSFEVIYRLLKAGADPNLGSINGASLLEVLESRHEKFLLGMILAPKKYYKIHKTFEAYSRLIYQNSDESAIISFLEKQRNLNIQDPYGFTFLHYAVERGFNKAVKFLLDNGAELNAEEYYDKITPIDNALIRMNLEAYSMLHAKGIRTDTAKVILKPFYQIVNRFSNNEFKEFLKHPDPEKYDSLIFQCKLLVDISLGRFAPNANSYSIDVLRRSNPFGTTPLHFAARSRFPQLVAYFLSLGIPVDQANNLGETPLLYAVRHNNPVIAKMLVEAGAHPYIKNFEGLNPILLAEKMGMSRLAASLAKNEHDNNGPSLVLQRRVRPELIAIHPWDNTAAVSDGVSAINLWDLTSKLIFKKLSIFPEDSPYTIRNIKFLHNGLLVVNAWQLAPQVTEVDNSNLYCLRKYYSEVNYAHNRGKEDKPSPNSALPVDKNPIEIIDEKIFLVNIYTGEVVDQLPGSDIEYEVSKEEYWVLNKYNATVTWISNTDSITYNIKPGATTFAVNYSNNSLALGYKDGRIEIRSMEPALKMLQNFHSDLDIISHIYAIDSSRLIAVGGFDEAIYLVDFDTNKSKTVSFSAKPEQLPRDPYKDRFYNNAYPKVNAKQPLNFIGHAYSYEEKCLIIAHREGWCTYYNLSDEKSEVVLKNFGGGTKDLAMSQKTGLVYFLNYPFNYSTDGTLEINVSEFRGTRTYPFTRVGRYGGSIGMGILNDGETIYGVMRDKYQFDPYFRYWDIKNFRRLFSWQQNYDLSQYPSIPYPTLGNYFYQYLDAVTLKVFKIRYDTSCTLQLPFLNKRRLHGIDVEREVIYSRELTQGSTADKEGNAVSNLLINDFKGRLLKEFRLGIWETRRDTIQIPRITFDNDGNYLSIYCDSTNYGSMDVYRVDNFKKIFSRRYQLRVSRDTTLNKKYSENHQHQKGESDLPQILSIEFGNGGNSLLINELDSGQNWVNIIELTESTGKIVNRIKIDDEDPFYSCEGLNTKLNLLAKGVKRKGKHVVALWDLKTGKEIMQIPMGRHKNRPFNVVFHPEKPMLFISLEEQLEVYDVKDRKKIFDILPIPGSPFLELLFTGENNYYYSTTRNLRFDVAYEIEGRAYSFDQFDVRYNRPGYLLGMIPGADSLLVSAYEQAYHTRLEKYGLTKETPTTFDFLPVVSIDHRQIPPAVGGTELSLAIRVTDSRVPLKSIHITVNGVPIFGIAGKSLIKEQRQDISLTLKIPLWEHDNFVQVWAVNDNGVESLRENFTVFSQPQMMLNQEANLYFIGLGVSDFDLPEWDLDYPVKDVKDLSNFFMRGNKKNSTLLVNKQFSKKNLEKAKQTLLQSSIGDVVIVYVASHGLFDDNLNYYLATSSTNPDDLANTAIAYRDLENLLDGIPAKNKLLLVDACHSGEIDKNNFARIKEKNTNLGKIKFRSIGTGSELPKVGLENSLDIMKLLFADLRQQTGANVIASAGGVEAAIEGEAWNNSVFAFSLLKGLKEMQADVDGNNYVDVLELQEYLALEIPSLTENLQQPTFRAENVFNNFQIWYDSDEFHDRGPSLPQETDTVFANPLYKKNDFILGQIEFFLSQKKYSSAYQLLIEQLYENADNQVARAYLALVKILDGQSDQAKLIWKKFKNVSLSNNQTFSNYLQKLLLDYIEKGDQKQQLRHFLEDITSLKTRIER